LGGLFVQNPNVALNGHGARSHPGAVEEGNTMLEAIVEMLKRAAEQRVVEPEVY
jgi:hypothetical protein